jgi:putative transposase
MDRLLNGAGQVRTCDELAMLVVRMARENGSWGYTRIQGAMANIGRGTVRRILRDDGLEPVPDRAKEMLRSVFLNRSSRSPRASLTLCDKWLT